MSGMGPRGIKAARLGREETSRGLERPENEHRLLQKGPPGLIFMCNSRTKQDCFLYKVLGLPMAKRNLVEQTVPGTFLFLFDIEVRELHGIFEASSHGGINLEPKAFQGQGFYPAQVSKLIQLFRPIEAPRKRLLVDSAAAVLHEAGGDRLDLLGRALRVTGGAQLANRLPQDRLSAPGIRLEGGLPRHELALRQDIHPLVADGVNRHPVPQTRVLDGRPDQKDLLTLGRLEEVDKLALKYLQPGKQDAGRAVNSLHRNSAVEIPQSLQQEAILRSRALEIEHLRRAAVEQALLRDHGPLLPGASSSHAVSPFPAARQRAVAIPGPLRRSADIRRRW